MSDSNEGSGWVVEPPANGVVVSIDVPDEAAISPELRDALERLVRVIGEQQTEVAEGAEGDEPAEAAGFQVFKPRCKEQMKCDPYTVRPCYARTIHECVIVACPSYTKPIT